MSVCTTLNVSVRQPEGKHTSLTADELELQELLRQCGYQPVYEPVLLMFRRWDPQTHRFFDTGVQPDFYIPELDLYVELTRKRNLRRKLEQVELMVSSNHRMVLIDLEAWLEINGDAARLQQLILAAVNLVSREAAAFPRTA